MGGAPEVSREEALKPLLETVKGLALSSAGSDWGWKRAAAFQGGGQAAYVSNGPRSTGHAGISGGDGGLAGSGSSGGRLRRLGHLIRQAVQAPPWRVSSRVHVQSALSRVTCDCDSSTKLITDARTSTWRASQSLDESLLTNCYPSNLRNLLRAWSPLGQDSGQSV